MNERPIVMSGDSVWAILNGWKTQDRRAVFKGDDNNHMPWRVGGTHWQDGDDPLQCPFAVGQRLWSREPLIGVIGTTIDPDEVMPICAYQSDGSHIWTKDKFREPWTWPTTTLPAASMPRRFSRLTLEIANVRVERLQAISDDDVRAEGSSSRDDYQAMWDDVNGKARPWSSNPWVWALTFKVVKS